MKVAPLNFFYIAAGTIAAYGLSIVVHVWPAAALAVLAVAGLAMAYLGFRKPQLGLWLILVELMIGSQGRWVALGPDFTAPSIRQALFTGFLIGWVLAAFRRRRLEPLIPQPWRGPYLLVCVAVLFSMLRGWAQFGATAMIPDANGYWYLLLAPALFASIKPQDWPRIGRVAAGAQAALALLTLSLVVWFAWVPPAGAVAVYTWVRDARLAEVTHVLGSFWRVFFQSHLFNLFVALGALAALVSGGLWSRRLAWAAMLLGSAAVVASFSRSLWFAGSVAFLALLWHLRRLGWSFKRLGGLLAVAVGVLAVEVVLLQVVTGNFPTPAFSQRLDFLGEPAAQSRLAQLGPLWQGIGEHWLLGSGFGRQLSYHSSDPRRGGWTSTSVFEWGWLDTWLDIGLVGVFAIAWWLWRLLQWSRQAPSGSPGPLVTLLVTCALAAVHVFTPYLNHPLGLGALLWLSSLQHRVRP